MISWLLSIFSRVLPDRAPAGSGPRSPLWPGVRRTHLSSHPTCAACGSRRSLQVHHKIPYHLRPELELEPGNLITLCEQPGTDHHLHVGHKGDWRSYNPNVEAEAAALLAKE